MEILGIRTAPKQLRYALVCINGEGISLGNSESEHLIRTPATMEDPLDILAWQKKEIDRVIRINSDVIKIVLKVAEFGRNDTKITRLGAYLDAAVILSAKEANISVEGKLYSQLGTNRSQVKDHAEARVGRTNTHWNEQIADAIIAAWSARGDA